MECRLQDSKYEVKHYWRRLPMPAPPPATQEALEASISSAGCLPLAVVTTRRLFPSVLSLPIAVAPAIVDRQSKCYEYYRIR